jgi:hypothetical protein
MVQQLVLVGAVVSGMPYSDHFLNRGMKNSKPFEKSDKAAGVANWANDKYVLGTGHEEARKKLLQLLTANAQDLTHNDYARPTQATLPRLQEIKIPTLIVKAMPISRRACSRRSHRSRHSRFAQNRPQQRRSSSLSGIARRIYKSCHRIYSGQQCFNRYALSCLTVPKSEPRKTEIPSNVVEATTFTNCREPTFSRHSQQRSDEESLFLFDVRMGEIRSCVRKIPDLSRMFAR